MLRQAIRRYSSLPPYALKPAFGPADKAAAKAFKESLEATSHHAKETSGLWKKITFFVAVPSIALAAVNTYFVEEEHAKHREHLKHVPDQDWPKDYEFQNIRSKPFFWGDGDKTLFWNPVVNRHVSHDDA
ncbi:LAFE_0D04522g1_1 [Lachancea fermentati]|uniref:Cytochrome c oxidase subunit n=1 Tax=Lachancea fermentati TaxID=4955 RepID=A0A1G4MB83_LACFM|nr:LAFE_0D04522g1_1 [Lachancea fermentati]